MRRLALVAFAAALAACSYVPDAVDPFTWFEDDEPIAVSAPPPESTAATAEEPYPSLSSVPEAPEDAPEPAEFDEIAEGLAADQANAQYIDAGLQQADDEVGGTLPSAELTVAAAAQAPAPEPQPATTESVVIAGELSPPAQPLSAGTVPTASGEAVPAQPLDGSTVAPAAGMTAAAMPAPQYAGSVTEMFDAAFQSSGATTLAEAGVAAEPQAVAVAAQPIGSSPYLPGLATRQVATVYFGDGSARLSQEARDTLLRVAYDYGSTGGAIRIVGHASAGSGTTGSKLANLDVSMGRAVAVADALAELGVPVAAMTLEAASDNRPLAADAAHNRRVEIFLGG